MSNAWTINYHSKKPFGSIFKTKVDVKKWVGSLNKQEYKKFKTFKDKIDDAIEQREQVEHHEYMTKRQRGKKI
jgi:hypothetical protein